MKRYLVSGLVLSLLSCNSTVSYTQLPQHEDTPAGNKVVLMELFTSQGCSSCPPADILLGEYASRKDVRVIPISFHVDYWNRLGWVDPFSSSVYTARQQWYSQFLPEHGIYTPQMVVNGHTEAVGNNRNAVKILVENALKSNENEKLEISNVNIGINNLTFKYASNTVKGKDILQVALVQKLAETQIKAGENRGVKLANHNIVRNFISLDCLKEGTGTISLPVSFLSDRYALVIYSQQKSDHVIKAAVWKDL